MLVGFTLVREGGSICSWDFFAAEEFVGIINLTLWKKVSYQIFCNKSHHTQIEYVKEFSIKDVLLILKALYTLLQTRHFCFIFLNTYWIAFLLMHTDALTITKLKILNACKEESIKPTLSSLKMIKSNLAFLMLFSHKVISMTTFTN